MPAARLADPQSWTIERALLDGYLGPFTALKFLRAPEPYLTSIGPHMHCAGPPKAPSPEVATLTQLSTQPADISSCMAWYTVDIYLNEGVIEAITLDLF